MRPILTAEIVLDGDHKLVIKQNQHGTYDATLLEYYKNFTEGMDIGFWHKVGGSESWCSFEDIMYEYGLVGEEREEKIA